ncbi:oligosaccharide repeat unit polymerase [Rossellomorea sp. SC111]|uniref:O-antigen polymerase n=1 Tax=Rossellomorea sp. SC111 TaxID=2968985 RepID=UPI00215A1277|nr:oligosaccharide repeat unit polymerase [Rossellomorea sp. SC111]MCR8850560.1 oligosaccharide repeat unit polymerase [Rossellomorea sp. SC111]
MVYILIWILTLGISLFLFKKSSGSLSLFKPNMLSIIFYYSFFFSSFIGALLIVLGIDDNYMINRIRDDSVRVTGFYFICYIMIFTPLTMFVISNLLGFKGEKEFKEYLEKPISVQREDSKDIKMVFSITSIICLFAIAYVTLKLDKIPIIEMFKGSGNLGELRIEASHNFRGNIYIKNILAMGLTPILSLVAYAFAVGTKQLFWKLSFVVLFASSLYISIYDLQKAPIFFYLLMLILISIYLGRLKLNWKKVTLIGLLGVSFITILYIFVQKIAISEFFQYNTGPIGRIILTQIAPFYLHLEFFSNYDLNGSSLPSIFLDLYNIEHVRSARVVMEAYYPEKVQSGIAGVLNTLYAGEAFANFGYKGILFSTFYIGIFTQLLYILFIRLPKHPFLLALFVYFSINIPRVMVGGITEFIFNPFWLFIFVFFSGLLISITFKNKIIKGYKGYLGYLKEEEVQKN